jgi:hypothetical protein
VVGIIAATDLARAAELGALHDDRGSAVDVVRQLSHRRDG